MESSMSEMGKNTLPRPGRQGAFSMGAPGPGPAPGYQKWLPGKPLPPTTPKPPQIRNFGNCGPIWMKLGGEV